jgi:hypothetical protein
MQYLKEGICSWWSLTWSLSFNRRSRQSLQRPAPPRSSTTLPPAPTRLRRPLLTSWTLQRLPTASIEWETPGQAPTRTNSFFQILHYCWPSTKAIISLLSSQRNSLPCNPFFENLWSQLYYYYWNTITIYINILPETSCYEKNIIFKLQKTIALPEWKSKPWYLFLWKNYPSLDSFIQSYLAQI